jgi:hypothetical protein
LAVRPGPSPVWRLHSTGPHFAAGQTFFSKRRGADVNPKNANDYLTINVSTSLSEVAICYGSSEPSSVYPVITCPRASWLGNL